MAARSAVAPRFNTPIKAMASAAEPASSTKSIGAERKGRLLVYGATGALQFTVLPIRCDPVFYSLCVESLIA